MKRDFWTRPLDDLPVFRTIGAIGRILGRIIESGARVGFRIARVAAKVVAILLVLGVILHITLGMVWSRQLEKKLAELRAHGEKLTLAELAPKPVPDEQNAAIIYQQAFKARKTFSRNELLGSSCISILQPEERKEIKAKLRRTLEDNSRCLELVELAVQKPECVFQFKKSALPNPYDNHLFQVRCLTSLVTARAVEKELTGDISGALHDLTLALRVSRTATNEPTIEALIARDRCVSEIVSVMEATLRNTNAAPSQTRSVFDELASTRDSIDFRLVLVGQRAYDIDYYAQTRKKSLWLPCCLSSAPPNIGDKVIANAMAYASMLLWKPYSYKDERMYLDLSEKMIPCANLPYREVVEMAPFKYTNSAPFYAYVSKPLLEHKGYLWCTRDKLAADTGVAQVALALKAYKSTYGAYPKSLTALKTLRWKLPQDPFSGKPFCYKREGSGFLLYSYGSNLKNDGGRVVENGYYVDPNKSDIVWRSTQ